MNNAATTDFETIVSQLLIEAGVAGDSEMSVLCRHYLETHSSVAKATIEEILEEARAAE